LFRLSSLPFSQCYFLKVELNAIKPWISKKITEILGFEDEVVINLAVSELESQDEKGPCPKKIQLNLTGRILLKKNN
jgi:hypothetical protein